MPISKTWPIRSQFHIPTSSHTFGKVLSGIATDRIPLLLWWESQGGQGGGQLLLSQVMAIKLQAWLGVDLFLELIPDSSVRRNLSAAMLCH